MEWLEPVTKGLWVLWVGIVVGVIAFRVRAGKRKPRFVEFAGEGVGEENGRIWVSFEVPAAGKEERLPIRLEWLDVEGMCWLEWEEHLSPGFHTRAIEPKGTPGKCCVRLTAPGIRAERYIQWNGHPLHSVGHFNAEQPHG